MYLFLTRIVIDISILVSAENPKSDLIAYCAQTEILYIIVFYNVRAQIVLYLRSVSTLSRSIHALQKSLYLSASEPTRRHNWNEVFPPTLTQIAIDYKSKNNSANAIETVESTRLVKEDLDRNFPETAQLSVRLYTVFLLQQMERNKTEIRNIIDCRLDQQKKLLTVTCKSRF